jgi:hypothetical protein
MRARSADASIARRGVRVAGSTCFRRLCRRLLFEISVDTLRPSLDALDRCCLSVATAGAVRMNRDGGRALPSACRSCRMTHR